MRTAIESHGQGWPLQGQGQQSEQAGAASIGQVTDTYFVVAHLHCVLFGGKVFAIFAGIYASSPA